MSYPRLLVLLDSRLLLQYLLLHQLHMLHPLHLLLLQQLRLLLLSKILHRLSLLRLLRLLRLLGYRRLLLLHLLLRLRLLLYLQILLPWLSLSAQMLLLLLQFLVPFLILFYFRRLELISQRRQIFRMVGFFQFRKFLMERTYFVKCGLGLDTLLRATAGFEATKASGSFHFRNCYANCGRGLDTLLRAAAGFGSTTARGRASGSFRGERLVQPITVRDLFRTIARRRSIGPGCL